MKSIAIPARDNFPLAARVFEGDAHKVWIIHSATAVPQRFYGPFAQDMARRGATVVTYDYRGIGESRPGNIPFRKFAATMSDWARRDADGVHDWVHREYPEAEVSVVGHSFGGQMLGMLENRGRIRRALMVAAQNGYWRYFAPKNRPTMLLYWYVVFPACLATLGYVPMKRFRSGEDLPGGVARQWRRWCMHPDYLFSDLDAAAVSAYKAFAAPILAYGFTDDAFAGGQAIERLIERYPLERVKLRTLSPTDLGVRSIGHFGFFKRDFQETLWQEGWDWLHDGRARA